MNVDSSPHARTKRGPGRPPGGGVLVDRAQLLDAATILIRERGPDVTMAEIAAAATVTKPILYRTIGDREALTSALSETLIDRVNAAVDVRRGSGNDARADFHGAVSGYLAAIATDRNLFLFVNGGNHDTAVVQRLVDRSAEQLVDLFTAAGRDRTASQTWSHAIVGAFQIVALMWLRDDYCEIDTLADNLTEFLWPGVSGIGDAPADSD